MPSATRQAPTSRPEKFWTIPEIAELLGVSKNTVYRRIASGSLKAVDIGEGRAKARIPDSALIEYQARRRPIGLRSDAA